MSLVDDIDALVVAPPDWHADALCREYPEVTFFPEKGQPTAPAKALCARCLVRDECLATALATGETFGVWGGTSDKERKALRRAQEAA